MTSRQGDLMWYRAGADLVVVVHLLFIGFIVGGVFLTWRWPLIIWAHIPAMIYGALVEFTGFTCPLTLLENNLRQRAGDAGYRDGFLVTLEGSDGQLVRTTLPDGTTILTGPFVLTIRNPANSRSATFNISGPTFRSGGELILTGSAIILLFSDLAPPGPGILAINGRGTVDANQDFNFDTFKGHSRDVCQQLS